MSDYKLLHAVVNNAHYSKKVDKTYITNVMHDDYNISIERINLAFDKSLTDGTLQPDGRGGYFSTEDPAFDYDDANVIKSTSQQNSINWTMWGTIVAVIGIFVAIWLEKCSTNKEVNNPAQHQANNR